MVVEFVGLPGVGKSTLSQRIAEILSRCDIDVQQPSYILAHKTSRLGRITRKIAYFTDELILSPKCAMLSTAAIIRTKQKTPADCLKLIFNWSVVSSLIRRNRRIAEVTLIDQGIFQALWSIGFSARDEAWASTMSGRAPPMSIPDMVVVVEASPRTISDRLRARRRYASRLEAKLQTDPALLARSVTPLEAVRMMMSRQQIAVMVVSTEAPETLSVTATEVAETIMTIMNSRLEKH